MYRPGLCREKLEVKNPSLLFIRRERRERGGGEKGEKRSEREEKRERAELDV